MPQRHRFVLFGLRSAQSDRLCNLHLMCFPAKILLGRLHTQSKHHVCGATWSGTHTLTWKCTLMLRCRRLTHPQETVSMHCILNRRGWARNRHRRRYLSSGSQTRRHCRRRRARTFPRRKRGSLSRFLNLCWKGTCPHRSCRKNETHQILGTYRPCKPCTPTRFGRSCR